MLVPTAYLQTLVDANKLDSIHADTEANILKIKNEEINEGLNDVSKRYDASKTAVLGVLKTTGKPRVPRSKVEEQLLLQKLNILKRVSKEQQAASDSSQRSYVRLKHLVVEQSITLAQIREKGEIISYNLRKAEQYSRYFNIFFYLGMAMSFYGFVVWHRKENAGAAYAKRRAEQDNVTA